MKLESKRIGEFLSSLNPAERRYLETTLDLSNNIQALIKNNEWLTKEVFCKMVSIEEIDYDNYVSGNRNYDMMDIAKINALHAECERRKAKPVVDIVVDILPDQNTEGRV